MRLVTVPLIALLVFYSVAANAKDKGPVQLSRIGKWEVNYDEDSCHLYGKFGAGDTQVTVNLTRYSPGDAFDLSLYGAMVKSSDLRVNAEITFEGYNPMKMVALAGTAGQGLPALLMNGIRLDGTRQFTSPRDHPTISPVQEAAVQSFELNLPGGRHYRFASGSMAAPMTAMRACTDDLIKHWGYNVVEQNSLRSPAIPLIEPSKWLATKDFPLNAAFAGQSGIVQVRIDVDESGSVTGCHVLHRTNPDQFADLTCKLISQRARLSPAINADGKPVRSFYATRIVWLSSGS